MGAKREGTICVVSDYVREVQSNDYIRTPIVLWSGAMTTSLRTWPHNPRIGFLLLSGGHDNQRSLPNADVIASWEDNIAQRGFRHIRTNAIASGAAQQLRELGYTSAQELCVLQVNTYLAPVPPVAHDLRPKRVLFSRSRIGRDNRITQQLVQLDCAAFGVEWGLDHIALREALRATTTSEIFVVRRHTIEGFILVGAADNRGYIQRLAVAPQHQRSGIAATLLSTALAWLRTRQCEETIVNTEFTNTAALNLYRKFGFAELPYHLTVMEKQVGN
jgi:ribosomal protein S18 acetylase RimI-like enzyme